MTLYPAVQQRAQQEIDLVVGANRLSCVEDRDSLVYLNALMLEVLRWNPVAPLGLYHRVTMDDEYEGMFIPKGSILQANIWAITQDEEFYPEPTKFEPERHLPVGEDKVSQQPDPREYVFGFGRRICPGMYFAETSLFLNMAGVLAAFNISKALDKDGKEITPKVEYQAGIVSHVVPFQCNITPRSSNAAALVKSAVDM